MPVIAHGWPRLYFARRQALVCVMIYSRMVTGGVRTYADWLFVREAAK